MFRKGELTTEQIVILIVLVASFAVILFFIFRLNLGQETEDEICHNSVITRGKSILPTETFPLKCKRSYVCLSVDGKCEKMVKPDLIKVETKEEVYKVLADELADCWWMFGEGKVDYVGKDALPELYCSICSQVAFDDSVKDVFGGANEFDKEKFYEYLSKNEKSKGETYLEYLFNTNDLSNIYSGDFGKISLDKQYYSLIGIKSKTSELTWATLGTLTFVAGVLTGGSIWVVGVLALSVGGGGYFVAPIVSGGSGNDFILPSLIKANSPEIDSLGCDFILTSS